MWWTFRPADHLQPSLLGSFRTEQEARAAGHAHALVVEADSEHEARHKAQELLKGQSQFEPPASEER